MSSVNDLSGVPQKGKNLIVVAAISQVLHFRIFDCRGQMVVDTDETRVRDKVPQLNDLKNQLDGLWPPHQITGNEKNHSQPPLHRSSLTPMTRH